MIFEFVRVNCKIPCAGNAANLANHMIRIIDCYLNFLKPKFTDQEEIEIPSDMEEKLYNSLVFAAIWGVGGTIDELTRQKFDTFLMDLLAGVEDVRVKYELDMGPGADEKYPLTKIPHKLPGEIKSLFELYYNQEDMKWENWWNTVPHYTIDKEASYLQLAIPTIDSIRMQQICETLLKVSKHVLFVGPTGTGKSIQVNMLLKDKFDNEQWAYYLLGFSAQTTANQTERIIDGSMDKRRKGVFGPKLGKEGVIFVDDLNMP